MIKGHKHLGLTDLWTAPYESYLLVTWGTDGAWDAFELSDDANINDIQSIINEAYKDIEIECTHENQGCSNYCEIKLDGRTPNESICWDFSDIYLKG